MIDVEAVARIRHLYYAEHWRVGTIAEELGLHHETVQRALSEGPRAPAGPRLSLFDPYVGFVRETLEQHPRLTATRLWHMLRERGCPLSVRQVRDKVRALRPSRHEAFLRRRTFVGEEAQVDWASFGHVRIGAARRALSAFVLTLTLLAVGLPALLPGPVAGELPARPRLRLRGPPRGAAATASTTTFARPCSSATARVCASTPGCSSSPRITTSRPGPARPGRGSEKGAVERTVRYVRDSFFAARSFTTIEDLNRQALAWRDEVAGARRWPGDDRKTVAEAFEEEAPQLLTLPAHPFETDLFVPVRSEKTIYVRFDLNDYSIPPTAVGRALTLSVSETTVRILDGASEIARHRRSYDRHQRVEDPAHVEALLEEKRRARGSVPRTRLSDAVPDAEAFLEACFQRGESVAATTEKLLLLLDDYGAAELAAAVGEALARQTPRLGSVAFLLARRRRTAQRRPALPVELSRRPDLKDLYVKPHPLGELRRARSPRRGGRR